MKLTKKQIQTRRKWADALQTSNKGFHQLITKSKSSSPRYCCLGVYLHTVCGVPNETLRTEDIGTISSLDSVYGSNIVDSYIRDVGLDIEGEDAFISMNDGVWDDIVGAKMHMSHEDIGLYLYLTCEAGEAFDMPSEI